MKLILPEAAKFPANSASPHIDAALTSVGRTRAGAGAGNGVDVSSEDIHASPMRVIKLQNGSANARDLQPTKLKAQSLVSLTPVSSSTAFSPPSVSDAPEVPTVDP